MGIAALYSLHDWVHQPWLAWGLAPYLCYVMGYLIPVAFWEVIIRQSCARSCMLAYGKDAVDGGRASALQKIQAQPGLAWSAQLWGALGMLFGPTSLLNAGAAAILLPLFVPPPDVTVQCWTQLVLQVVALELVGDFGLYVGHRIQHEIPFLWKNYHKHHHKVLTPTPVTTLFIHPVDATLQGGLPIMGAAVMVRPHPMAFWVYVWLRIAENVTNHSGLSGRLVEVLTFKMLPLRCSIAHHDSHHRFSNHSGSAKNYGENFWIWDWMFGTLRPVN